MAVSWLIFEWWPLASDWRLADLGVVAIGFGLVPFFGFRLVLPPNARGNTTKQIKNTMLFRCKR